MTSPLPLIVNSGRLAVDLMSGRGFTFPEVPAPFLKELLKVLDIVGCGVGFVLDRDSGREGLVFVPLQDAQRDLVEFLSKPGPFLEQLQQLLDRSAKGNRLQGEREVESPDGLRGHAEHGVLLLAIPLKDCTPADAGKSS